MASDLNKVILIGHLVRDPESKFTANGTAVANFSIASNRTYTVNGEKKEQVSFFNCIAWQKLSEIITQYCKKGHKIGIEGHLQQRSWQDQDGNKRSAVEVVVENFQFLTPRDSQPSAPQQQSAQQIPEDNPFSDDSIPF